MDQQKGGQAQEAALEMQAAAATMLQAGSREAAAAAAGAECHPRALSGSSSPMRKGTCPDRQSGHSGGGTSKYRGVSWAARSHKWRVQLWFSSTVCPIPHSLTVSKGSRTPETTISCATA